MMSSAIERVGSGRSADLPFGNTGERGSAGHPYVDSVALLAGPDATRNLADAVHYLCELHGPFPGVIDVAAERAGGSLHNWLQQAAELFTTERTWLTRLVAAAGPLPSTPGQAESEATLTAQRHALDMLARSDRFGCALGTALALLHDWRAIHAVLNIAAERFGLEPIPFALPDDDAIRAVANEASTESPAMARAIAFGAQQLLLQHNGLWSLLEAREAARLER